MRVRASGKRYLVANFSGRQIAFGPADDPESKRRYERFRGSWVTNGRQVPTEASPTRQALTVDALADAFNAHSQVYYRREDGTQASEVTSFASALRFLVAECLGQAAANLAIADQLRVREPMVAADLARDTVNGSVSRLRLVFGWGSVRAILGTRQATGAGSGVFAAAAAAARAGRGRSAPRLLRSARRAPRRGNTTLGRRRLANASLAVLQVPLQPAFL